MSIVKKLAKRNRGKDQNPFMVGDLVEVCYTSDLDRSIIGYFELLDENWRGPYCILYFDINGDCKSYKIPLFWIGHYVEE